MIFEGADGTFSGVASMHARWHQLEVDLLLLHKLFENVRAFIVQTLQFRTKPSKTEVIVNGLERFKNGRCFAVGNGLGKNGVAVKVVKNKQVIVASARRRHKAACLICVDLSCGLEDGSITRIGGVAVIKARGKRLVVVWQMNEWINVFFRRGPLALSGLV